MSDPFFSREGWNHDNIGTSAVQVDDWNELRTENYDGVGIILPPITRQIMVDQGFKLTEFDAEDWLLDNIPDHLTEEQTTEFTAKAEADDQDLEDWLLEDDRWLAILPADQGAKIVAALEEAKEEFEEDELEDEVERFQQSDAYFEWKDGFEPVMNYYWPVDLAYGVSPSAAAERIEQYGGATSLVYIESVNTYAIVLTGGGMDLSWDICAAYICCGCIPPSRLLLGLPHFAGGYGTRFGKLIVDTLLPLLVKHFEWQVQRAKDEITRLSDYLAKREA